MFGSHEGVDAQRRTRSTGDAEDAIEDEPGCSSSRRQPGSRQAAGCTCAPLGSRLAQVSAAAATTTTARATAAEAAVAGSCCCCYPYSCCYPCSWLCTYPYSCTYYCPRLLLLFLALPPLLLLPLLLLFLLLLLLILLLLSLSTTVAPTSSLASFP